MAWDDTKSTADDPNNPSGVEQLTATEWNNMVSDQKSRITGVSVEDDGTVVLETEEINFGSNLSVSDDGDDTVTVNLSNSVSVTDLDADTYTVDNSNALMSVVASGNITLSSGTATVDTGISASSATFYLALGVDDPNADVSLAGKLFWDDSAGTYKITIDEVDTSVGNPTANYDVLRVR